MILTYFQFLHNQKRETVVSYDDTFSLASKAKYAKEVGMAGCFTWSLDQVSRFIEGEGTFRLNPALQDDGLALHEAVRDGLGLVT